MDYLTSSGRRYSYSPGGPTAVQLFEQGKYAECLHLLMFYFQFAPADLARGALEDDGVLHELLHLVTGIETAIGNDVWDAIVDAESQFPMWVRNHRYLLIPGEVGSPADKQVHYVTAAKLQHLYQVRPADCRIYEADRSLSQFNRCILLTPQYSGNYSILKSVAHHD